MKSNTYMNEKSKQLDKKYIRRSKVIGFIALIIVPASPLYLPLICAKNDLGYCEVTFIPILATILIAILLASLSIFFWVKAVIIRKDKKI
jgi:hypothetical protein